jgi:hypothetical protein
VADEKDNTGAAGTEREGQLSDTEIVIAWMEPGLLDIWMYRGRLTLDALWEVEERLTNNQWLEYRRQILGYPELAMIRDRLEVEEKRLLHATPFVKIRALAAVLRPLMEKS